VLFSALIIAGEEDQFVWTEWQAGHVIALYVPLTGNDVFTAGD
jgi:hypothetical protein